MENMLYQYGVLGLATFSFGYLLYKQWQLMIAKNQYLEKRIDDLQIELREYLINDRAESNQIIERNTTAFEHLMQSIKNLSK